MAPVSSTTPNRKLGALILVLVALFVAALSYFVGVPMIRMVREPETFRAWVSSHGFWGSLAFVGMMVFQIVVAIIPGEPFETGAGYAFGFWKGTILCMIACLIGSAIVFGLTRKYGRRFALLFFSEEKLNSLKFLSGNQKSNTLYLLLMILPASPKDLLSYAAGLTKMKFSTWMLIVLVSRWPSLVTSTLFGDQLGKEQYWLAAGIFLGTAVLSLAGWLVYNIITKKRAKRETAPHAAKRGKENSDNQKPNS